MSIPRINPNLLSPSVRLNYERLQAKAQPNLQKGVDLPSLGSDSFLQEKQEKSEHQKVPKKSKATLTPDIASTLVKRVRISEDGNEVKITLALDATMIPTAQGKGVFVDKNGHAHFFTKPKQRKAEEAFKIALSPYAHISRSWGDVPVELEFKFFIPYPESTPKKLRHKIGPHNSRPDADNAIKSLADQMTRAGFWKDDSFINTYHIYKRRTSGPACTVIRIANLQPKFEALYQATDAVDNPTLFTQNNPPLPSETNPLQDQLFDFNSKQG